MKIKNCPNEAWNYEFIVVYDREERFSYYAHTSNGFYADKLASEINGVIIHNVRIQGKKEVPTKTYIFSGTWSYTCHASSKEEAEEMFNDAELNDFSFNFDYCNLDVLEDD